MKGSIYLIMGVVTATILATAPAQAAAFDCARPALLIARIVCNDPTLSRTDEALAETYTAALDATLDRPSLREQEEQWFTREVLIYNWYAQHSPPIDTEALLQAYERHMDDLRRATQLWHDVRVPISLEPLAASCLVLPSYPHNDTCRVTAFAAVVGDPSLRYQLQGFSSDNPGSAGIVFQPAGGSPGKFVPIVAGTAQNEGNAARYEAPRAINASDGRLLFLKGTFAESDHADASALYLYGDRSVREVDIKSWTDELPGRLPADREIAGTIDADYGTMTATAPLRPEGRAEVSLGLDDARVVIRDVKLDLAAPLAAGKPN